MSRTTVIRECLDLCESKAVVDRDAGQIRNVKILGWKSANGRSYNPDGVDPSLYEGKSVNVNHAAKGATRSAYDRFGRFINVTKTADGLYGTLQYLKSHELAERVCEAAERMPNVFGMSHTAKGREKRGPRGCVIEQVERVESVDLVGDPATVAGLFESRGYPVQKSIRDLAEALKAPRPKYSAVLTEMAESGIMSPTAMMDDPGSDPAADDAGGDHCAALIDAAKAVLDDDALDTPTKIKKIKDILKIVDGDKGGKGAPPAMDDDDDDEEEETDDDEDEEEKEESVKQRKKGKANLREENKRLKAREMVRAVADEAGVRVSKTLLENLNPAITEAQAKTLVVELKGSTSTGQRPRSASGDSATKSKTVTESKNGDSAIDTSEEARRKRIAAYRTAR